MPRNYLFANWKNRLSVVQSADLAKQVIASTETADIPFQLVLCPSFLALPETARVVNGSGIELGAQNLVWNDRFTFTGETRAQELVEIGCKFVIIGHSERRLHLNETEEMINKKVQAALASGLIPVICIGETIEEKNRSGEVIKNQLLSALDGISASNEAIEESMIIAYEPAWAISTSSVATPMPALDANEIHQHIREILSSRFSVSVGKNMSVVYGGSTDPTNVFEYLEQPGIDGCLIGSASQKLPTFLDLIEVAANVFSPNGTY